MKKSQFTSNSNKGFTLDFQKGLTISVQWGEGNYCSRRNTLATLNSDLDKNTPNVSCVNAEIAIWNIEGEYFKFKGERNTLGFCNTDDVAKFIHFTSLSRTFEELQVFVKEWEDYVND